MSTDPFDEPHSAAYFGEQRDFWWKPDYLKLVASRLRLASVRSALDVGAGIGHWTSIVAGILPGEATIVGVDRERQWIADATDRAGRVGLSDRCRFIEGVAEALPFQDTSFDLVTCQTLLIHVSDPAAVISEMRRVVRPGGLLLLSEPNNLAGMLVADSTSADEPVKEVTERIEFALLCMRGKAALGEGDLAVADLLPGLVAQAGLIDIRCMLNDNTDMLCPPYTAPEQEALKAAIIADADSDWWVWSKTDTRRYFLAGGGSGDEFDARWQRRLTASRRIARQLSSNRHYTGGGAIHYLVSGRRPE